VLPALPTTLPLLCVALLLFGATAGLADMAMNAEGVLVEERLGFSVMSGFHGFWSAGVIAGSAVSALATRAGVDARAQFAATAVVLTLAGVTASWQLLDEHRPEETDPPPAFALPTRHVLMIGLVGLCCVFAEGAGIDWSALYVRRELGGSASVAALAVSVFSIAMAGTRLVGDRAVRRVGPVRTVRLAGVIACTGAVAIVVAPDLAVGLLGFGLLGIGCAVVVPLVFAAAGRVGPHPARSIAGVAGVAYGGGLVAPGVIGGIASVSSLTVSFGVVAVLVALMALGAGILRPAAS
jgi:fucose permease